MEKGKQNYYGSAENKMNWNLLKEHYSIKDFNFQWDILQLIKKVKTVAHYKSNSSRPRIRASDSNC